MTLLAPSSLLVQVGHRKQAQRFVLASNEWIDLQNRIQSVLALRSDIGEYHEVQMNSDMISMGNMTTEANVGSVQFLVKAKSQLAVDSWRVIDDSAMQCTVHSLVDYTSLASGHQMPENEPLKRAA